MYLVAMMWGLALSGGQYEPRKTVRMSSSREFDRSGPGRGLVTWVKCNHDADWISRTVEVAVLDGSK